MALRRKVFNRARLAQVWDRTLSDDLTLTVEVRRLGLETRFVPSCVAVSFEGSTLAQTVEFTNRQSLISRIYFPPLWRGAAIGHGLGCFFVLYGCINLSLFAFTSELAYALGAACLMVVPLQWINALLLLGPIKKILPSLSHSIHQLRWHYMLTASVAPFLTLINTVNSLLTNRITWRGIQYEMRSPTETIVLNPSVPPSSTSKPVVRVRS